MEIETDGRAADAEAADQNLFDEIPGRGGGERGVEFHYDGAMQPGRRQQAELVALAGKLEQRLLRLKEQPRMRREGQRRGLAAELARALERSADHGAVAAVHAVEIADRHHGAGEHARLAVANDMKGVGRRGAHRTARRLEAVVFTADMLILAAC